MLIFTKCMAAFTRTESALEALDAAQGGPCLHEDDDMHARSIEHRPALAGVEAGASLLRCVAKDCRDESRARRDQWQGEKG